MTQTVLVTGVSGYLGGRVVSHLTKQPGITVRAGARKPPRARPEWLASAEVVPLELFDDAQLAMACQGMDAVVHLAAVNEIISATDPKLAVDVNITGTVRVLRAAQAAGAGRFLYISTAHVYGAPLAGRIDENCCPRPVHPYAITHLAAEHFVLGANGAGPTDGIVLRLSNGIGAPVSIDVDRWTLLGNDLCRQAVQDRVLRLRSSGTQFRDFITLEDVCRATGHFLGLSAASPRCGIFNLGGNCSLPIIGLAERVAARCQVVLGFTPPILRQETGTQEGAPLEYRIDRLLATGFRLTGDFDREIDETLRLCSQHQDWTLS